VNATPRERATGNSRKIIPNSEVRTPHLNALLPSSFFLFKEPAEVIEEMETAVAWIRAGIFESEVVWKPCKTVSQAVCVNFLIGNTAELMSNTLMLIS